MRVRKILPINNFPHRFFAVVAVFAFVAFLLTIKPVAEVVQKGAQMVGINFPPLEIFQNTASNMLLVGIGAITLLVAGIILVPIIKVIVTLVAVAIVGYGLFNIYKTFTGRGTQNILPTK